MKNLGTIACYVTVRAHRRQAHDHVTTRPTSKGSTSQHYAQVIEIPGRIEDDHTRLMAANCGGPTDPNFERPRNATSNCANLICDRVTFADIGEGVTVLSLGC